jgi:hypothetical protein
VEVAQGEGPDEFKPQYWKQKTRLNCSPWELGLANGN